MPCGGSVRQGEYGVRLVEGRLIAVADLEAFLIPVYELELFLQSFHIAIDVTDLQAWTSDDQPSREVQWRLLGLLDELVGRIERIGKRLIDVSWEKLWVNEAVQRRQAAH